MLQYHPFENYVLGRMYERPDEWHEFSTIYQGLENYTDPFDRRTAVMRNEGLIIVESYWSMLFGGRMEPRIRLSGTGIKRWEERLKRYELTNAEALELVRENIMERDPKTGIHKSFWPTLTKVLQGERT